MKYTVQIARTQYAYIEVDAKDVADAFDKADEYYDENFEEIDCEFETSLESYEKTVVG